MPAKSRVVLTIESRHLAASVSSEEERNIQTYAGEVFFRGGSVYYRYDETDPGMGRTATTLKVKEDEIKVIRHGEVRSEQSFAREAGTTGFFRFPQGNLPLQMETHRIAIDLKDGIGHLSWAYDLFMEGDLAGSYELNIKVTPLSEAEEESGG